MSELVRKEVIFYNSNSRIEGTINQHTTIFPVDLFTFEHDEYGEIEFVQFDCKQSYYNISSTRNSSFTYSENGVGGEVTCTLTEGNYSVKELSVEIQRALNVVATDLVFTITYDLKTLKYTFTFTGTPAGGSVYIKPISGINAFAILGFNEPADTKTLTSGIVSDKIISVGNLDALFIHCDHAVSRHINEEHNESGHSHFKIWHVVPVITTSHFGTIYWEQTSGFVPTLRLPTAENINTLKFGIRDKDGNSVELTEDWTAIFYLKVYKKQKYSQTKLNALMALSLMDSKK